MRTRRGAGGEPETVERYGRAGRWWHAATYVGVLILLGTGWWFLLAGYLVRSPLGHLLGVDDQYVHEIAGTIAAFVFAVGILLMLRSAWTFLRASVRFHRGDLRWFRTWLGGLRTGRFAHHDEHLDPGQRVANVVMMLTLGIVMVTGLAMQYLSLNHDIGGTFLTVHRWATFALTPVILGHILVASGLLPGYRGVWRSMHLGGRLPADVSRRIWPGWTDRRLGSDPTRSARQAGERAQAEAVGDDEHR